MSSSPFAPSIVVAVLALASTSPAQIADTSEFLHGGDGFTTHSAIVRPGGGFVVSGAIEYQSPDLPGPTYIARTPFLMFLDANGQLESQRTLDIGFDNIVDPTLFSVDAAGRTAVSFRMNNVVHLRGFAADGTPTYSKTIANTAIAVRGGMRAAPSGDFTVVARTTLGSIAVAGRDVNGNARFFTTPSTFSAANPAVATIDEAGRAASHTTGEVFVVEANGTVGWVAPSTFAVTALAFGPGGELAVAGVDSGTTPVLRVHEANGTVRFTRLEPQSANARWDAVTIDRFGRIAAAGSVGTGDASDGLVALYAADGTPAFARTWIGSSGFVDAFSRVQVSHSGDVFVAGRTDLNTSAQYWTNERRLVVAGFDPAGVELWNHVDAETGTRTETSAHLLEGTDGALFSIGTRSRQVFLNPSYAPLGVHVRGLDRQARGLCYGDTQSAACPCGNASAPGAQRGCANSIGNAARLSASGIASLSNDTLVLAVDGTTPTSPGLYFQGNVATSPTAFGDGLRCAGGTLRRLYTRQAVGGASSVPVVGDPSLSARAMAAGDVLAPGTTRVYQVSYRDLGAAFCPPPIGANQNASSALAIVWSL